MRVKIASLIVLLAATISIVGCGKDGLEEDERMLPGNNYIVATGDGIEAQCDSLYLYAKAYYLWQKALPDIATFNPRQYATGQGSDLEKLNLEIDAIKKYSPNEVDVFSHASLVSNASYIQSINSKNNLRIQSVFTKRSNGFLLKKIRGEVYIVWLDQNSPAEKAGFKRGWKITVVNSKVAKNLPIDELNSIINNGPAMVDCILPEGSKKSKVVSREDYSYSDYQKYKLLENGSIFSNAAYILLNGFHFSNDLSFYLSKYFSEIYNKGNIKFLILDLRYNPGGNNAAAEALMEELSPGKDKVMYTKQFNNLISTKIQSAATLPDAYNNIKNTDIEVLKNLYYEPYNGVEMLFDARGPIKFGRTKSNLGREIKELIFIVSGDTFSCSELLINSLRPYYKVTVIGKTTGGKPTGYETFTLGTSINNPKGLYEINLCSFYNKNSDDRTTSFFGIEPNEPNLAVEDDIAHELGSLDEACLKKALELIQERHEDLDFFNE